MPNIGDLVNVQYLDTNNGGVSRVSGALGVVLDAQEEHITEIVVETDGGATFIPRALLISVEGV